MVDFAGDGAFEAAQDVFLREVLRTSALDVGAGAGVGAEGAVEAWHDPAPALVVVTAGADPDGLQEWVTEALTRPGSEAVQRAGATARRRLRFEARTVTGKAELLGRLAGRGVDAAEYLDRLGRVTVDDVASLSRRALDTDPLTVELP
ncbi:MAG: hypothetical protein ACOC5I_01125 [Gemmatimonadota bacterium]